MIRAQMKGYYRKTIVICHCYHPYLRMREGDGSLHQCQAGHCNLAGTRMLDVIMCVLWLLWEVGRLLAGCLAG